MQGLSEAKVDKIKEVVAKVSVDGGFKTALQMSHQRKAVFRLNTGSQELK